MARCALVLGSYLPSTGDGFSEETKKRLQRALQHARCKKSTLVVFGPSGEWISKHNHFSRAGYLRGKGVEVEFISAKTLTLESEVRQYLRLSRRHENDAPIIIGCAQEELRVRLIAEYYFGETVAQSIIFVAPKLSGVELSKWFYFEPFAYAKYLPKVWQRRSEKVLRQTFGIPPSP